MGATCSPGFLRVVQMIPRGVLEGIEEESRCSVIWLENNSDEMLSFSCHRSSETFERTYGWNDSWCTGCRLLHVSDVCQHLL